MKMELKINIGSNIDDVLACRTCLATDTKLFNIFKINISQSFSALTGIYADQSILPNYICLYCFAILQKFALFRSRCLDAQEALEQLEEITTGNIKSLDRQHLKINLTKASAYYLTLPKDGSKCRVDYKLKHVEDDGNDSCSEHKDKPKKRKTSESKTKEVLKKYAKTIDPEITDKIKRNELTDPVILLNSGENESINKSYDEILNDIKNLGVKKCEIKIYDVSDAINSDVDEPEDLLPLSSCFNAKNNDTEAGTKDSRSDKNMNSDNGKTDSKKEVKAKVFKEKRKSKDNSKTKTKRQESDDESKDDNDTILPEFVSLFAKPKSDNFFTKDNMEKFTKEYHVDIKLLSKEDQIKEVQARQQTQGYRQAEFKCEICFTGFIMESTYKSHVAFHDPSRGSHVCEVCGVRHGARRDLLAHQRRAHALSFTCRLCGHATKNIKRAKFHYNHHKGVKIACKYCDKEFSQRAQHMEHVRVAHGVARCDICGLQLISDTGISRHKFWQHSEVVIAKCDTCGGEFHYADALKKHQEIGCSPDAKPCPSCGIHFTTQESLFSHMEEVHWNTLNAFKCPKCPKTYSSEKPLKSHLREHRRIQSRAFSSYVCEVCGQSFKDKKNMREHQRHHTGAKPYQCEICEKTFRLFSSYRTHIDHHANLRRYQCPLCPKSFSQAGHRAEHVRRHNNERPYVCSMCDRSFSCSGNARNHLLSVHMGIRRARKSRAKANKT